MAFLALPITIVLVVITLVAVINTLVFPRLKRPVTAPTQPRISVLIPARNEAAVISQTISNLLGQTYPHYEVILLDDQSTDGTAELAQAAGGCDPRFSVIQGKPLPKGWLGKNWACHQLSQVATGEWLVFTDADVLWSLDALSALIAEMERTGANLLTVWPTQYSVTSAERLIVPLMALAIYGYLPLPLVHYTPWTAFAAANGQCMAFRHETYQRVGGHASVRDQVVEDVTLARRVKANGLRLRMADGAGLIVCRMYRDWQSVRDGFAKNILHGHGNSLLFLMTSTVFHWLVFVFPWLWLFFGETTPFWPVWPLILVGLGVGVRLLTAVATRQQPFDALLMPVSVVLMTLIAAHSVWWRWRFGGPRWKGRTAIPKGSAARG